MGLAKCPSTELSHRASFSGIQFADLDATARAIKQYGSADRVFIRCAMDGTLYTDTTKTKDQRHSNSACVFCGQIDGFYHRLCECDFFADCEKIFRGHISYRSCHHALLVMAGLYNRLLGIDCNSIFLTIPDLVLDVKWPDVAQDFVFDLFTDGTCLAPTET